MIAKDKYKTHLNFGTPDSCGYLETLAPLTTICEGPGAIWSLDVLIYASSSLGHATQDEQCADCVSFDPQSPIVAFLLSAIQSIASSVQSPISARFLFSSEDGYVIRSDFLEQRLECSESISKVASFLVPLQRVAAVKVDPNVATQKDVFSNAIGAIIVKPNNTSADLDADLRNRLSIPWLLSDQLSPRRIAWVQGREDLDCIGRAFKAAAALGISLVILDQPGHWLQDPYSPCAYLREAFVEIDITPDEQLHHRIVEAIRAYPDQIDGVVTISDVRLPAIAKACQILGLSTESVEAYNIAGDKGRTRLLEPIGSDESFVLTHADDLDAYLKQRMQPLRFPLVIKPVVGWCSDCVSKVRNVSELTAAVYKASERHEQSAKRSTTVVVEPYVDGPEVDANLVLLDGEVLFYDINDDFPSPADERGAGVKANFQETQNVMPSGLPQVELDAIRDQMKESILRQGFRTGVFHCEARVRNSRVKYASKGDVIDLVSKDDFEGVHEPEVYLHEINARPPGYLESVAVLITYGVDYYALRMLLALGTSETPRLRALCRPFLNGPQFHLSLMIIQQTRAGTMKTPDATREFLDEHPKIAASVVDYYTRKRGGDVLEGPDASALWWIAFLSVTDRHSREELLKRVEYIQRNYTYETE